MAVSTVELVGRLLVTAVAVIGPTVLYFGLWRFLEWLRDDELVAHLAARGVIEEPDTVPADVLAAASAEVDERSCQICGCHVPEGQTRCEDCRVDFGGGGP